MPKNHVKFYSTDGKRQLLLVDSNAADRQALCEILRENYHIREEENGKKALAFFREHGDTLSLVVVDPELSDLDGLQLLTAMRADPEHAAIPVIFVTGDRGLAVEGLARGAIDFIPKPYPYPEVIKARVLRTMRGTGRSTAMTCSDALGRIFGTRCVIPAGSSAGRRRTPFWCTAPTAQTMR